MKIRTMTTCMAITIFLTLAVGCKQEAQNTSQTNQAASNDHEHGDSEGTHASETDHSVSGHGHGAGPHDGTIADWGGGKYHVEFTVSHEKQEATVFILGPDERTALPIAAEEVTLSIVDPAMQVTLKPVLQEGDPDGKASRFVGNHEKLGVVQEYAGTITGVIEGTPYSGDFAETAHEHE